MWSEKANCEFVCFMVNSLLRRKRKKIELPIFALAIKFKKGHHIYELRIKIMWTSIQVMTNTDIAITVVHLASYVSEKDGKCRKLDVLEIVWNLSVSV